MKEYPETIEIEEVRCADGALLAEMNHLLPQLSTSAAPLEMAELEEIVESPATRLLVARIRDRLVGSLTLVLFPIPTGRRAWIEDVVVDETARGQGVGLGLTEAALELAREAGAKSVDLTSRPSREAANRLYRRAGFEQRETNVYRFAIPVGEEC